MRILIVDDHPMVRQGLADFLSVSSDFEVVAQCAEAESALRALAAHAPDVVLVDLELPGRSGLWLLEEMRRRSLRALPVVLTSYADPGRVAAAVRAGARAYLLKRIDPDDLVSALRQVRGGRMVFDPEVAPALAGAAASGAAAAPFTPRERDVLDALLAGLSNKEIAASLGIAERTVKGHIGALLAKLGCQDRTQAVIAAYRLGLGPGSGPPGRF